MSEGQEDDGEILERFVACVRRHTPRATGPSRRADNASDAARIRQLFDVITELRKHPDWTWAVIAERLIEAQVPRSGGRMWTPLTLRRMYSKEAERRSLGRSWRQIKKQRAAKSAPVVGVSRPAGESISGGGKTGSPVTTSHGAVYDSSRQDQSSSGPESATEPGDVGSRLSLLPVNRKPKGTNTRRPEPEPPEVVKRKTGRDWNPADDMDYWGRANQNLQVIGPPGDWDGISRWSDRSGGWVHPDGTVRKAQKVLPEM